MCTLKLPLQPAEKHKEEEQQMDWQIKKAIKTYCIVDKFHKDG